MLYIYFTPKNVKFLWNNMGENNFLIIIVNCKNLMTYNNNLEVNALLDRHNSNLTLLTVHKIAQDDETLALGYLLHVFLIPISLWNYLLLPGCIVS